jgi:hypothetical protein
MKLLNLLKEAGCKPRNYGSYFTCSALYRGGNDPGSVAIYLKTNIVKDFVTGKIFSLEEFLKLTLNLNDAKEINQILDEKSGYFGNSIVDIEEDPFNKTQKFFSENYLLNLKRDNTYWSKRGISNETLQEFGGGVCVSGKMYQRYVFPIFDSRKKIQGFSGRDISGKSKIKWKHLGKKSEWAYPFIFNYKIIQDKKELILVESIGDMLSLWDSGIKNIGITFGTEIGSGLIKAILRLDPKKIIISTNNDMNQAGQNAALKVKAKLSDFFDQDQLLIKLPFANDFGEQTKEENQNWYDSV